MSPARNDHTGREIKTPPNSDAYRKGWDRIWKDTGGEPVDPAGQDSDEKPERGFWYSDDAPSGRK